jgi:hydroxypyruvate reductase
MNTPPDDLPTHLRALYQAAVAAVEPGAVLRAALDRAPRPDRAPHVIALGKAAPAMARAAVEWLAAHGMAPAGGVVVGAEPSTAPHPALTAAHGDHPEPGDDSAAAAAALARAAERASAAEGGPTPLVWVLLSGGSSSLLGAPVEGLSDADYRALCRLLLGSGLSIIEVNRIRKRFSRWGAGRLASALVGAEIRVWVISDVIGDDVASIGSGPCVPDPATAELVQLDLAHLSVSHDLPPGVFTHLEDVMAGRRPETPKPAAACFARVRHDIVAANRLAVQAAAAQAEALGYATTAPIRPIVGEAAEVGRQFAESVLKRPPGGPWCAIWGGEATVTLGEGSGVGGRCQEIALAVAERLAAAGAGRRIALLAAGTDGRDGPTDAAGAIVTPETWGRIVAAGLDPALHLRRHDTYPALQAVGALLVTGSSGTNVNDVVIAVEA